VDRGEKGQEEKEARKGKDRTAQNLVARLVLGWVTVCGQVNHLGM